MYYNVTPFETPMHTTGLDNEQVGGDLQLANRCRPNHPPDT